MVRVLPVPDRPVVVVNAWGSVGEGPSGPATHPETTKASVETILATDAETDRPTAADHL
jgi:hypothetical protein